VSLGDVSEKAPLLMLGLPKGSLEESTKSLFAKAGWKITTSSRSYKPSIDDPELDGRFVRAQEVSRYVEHGFFDCGLTGHDWVLENDSDVVDVCDFIYSKASTLKSRWVLCVPESSPVKTIADLAGKRVATELVMKTTRALLRKQGRQGRSRIFLGRHRGEGAGLGRCDRRHHRDRLFAPREQASHRRNAARDQHQAHRQQEELGESREAQKNRDDRAAPPAARWRPESKVGLEDESAEGPRSKRSSKALPALRNPTISQLSSPEWIALETIIDESVVREIIPQLKELGAEGIVEYPLNKVVY
jgi:ATP phosphoribosyltransferase